MGLEIRLFLAAFLIGSSGSSFAQIGRSISPGSPADVKEVPGEEDQDDGNDSVADDLAASEASELALSDAELRARHVNGAGVFFGEVVPWATAGAELIYLPGPYRAYSLVFGAGSFDQFGKRTDIRSVDITSKTRAVGLGTRWYFKGMPQFSIQATSTYVVWKGKASPHGADADEGNSALGALSLGFDASSLSLGAGLSVSRVWSNGVYFDWLPVGFKKSMVLKKSFSRSDGGVQDTVTKFIERQEIFGFINARVGVFF